MSPKDIFMLVITPTSQWSKSPKNSLKECFVNSALKIQCHTVKNTLLETAFSVCLELSRDP